MLRVGDLERSIKFYEKVSHIPILGILFNILQILFEKLYYRGIIERWHRNLFRVANYYSYAFFVLTLEQHVHEKWMIIVPRVAQVCRSRKLLWDLLLLDFSEKL